GFFDDRFPHLFAQLDAFVLRRTEALLELVHDLLDLRWWLLALFTARLEPLGKQHAGRVEGGVVRKDVIGEGEGVLGAVGKPRVHLRLIRSGHFSASERSRS